jgi:2-iminoacetate synthase
MTNRINPQHLTIDDGERILQSDDRALLEELAHAARETTRQFFGRAMGLYAPLYVSNYCENGCAYCGFHSTSKLSRKKLTLAEIDQECRALAATGIRSSLILTGESRYHSPPRYIRDTVAVAVKYFPYVALEVYPLQTDEYRDLYLAGADGVTLYQETYDRARYDELHYWGPKKDYDFRLQTPARIAEAGFRNISMGVLLGIADWKKDVLELFRHVRYLEKKFPGVEYGISFPRLRRVADDKHRYREVTDREMVKIICAARLLFPRAGISLSTREDAHFRDRVIEFGVTRISAGSSTAVGGYATPKKDYHDGQFEVHDQRGFAEVKSMLIRKGFDPVVTEWRNIVNQ